ncbi:hypothetical protein Xentx_02823 [Xenorhabdus thuongxuanensis]|uniref:Uncharacterized protein n=1 Tax=Xenorhabdus thuongxuanensis TaxID=1873484 RepID=A0A1Q5TV18_9GAMM|nr:hypothetical protein Xentx_02823 [Xenorhabdus thuongxuanensis]
MDFLGVIFEFFYILIKFTIKFFAWIIKEAIITLLSISVLLLLMFIFWVY